ncbi:MAG: peptidylprolyl isomerase [Chitinophagales bacterium]|nr:peptidylprolyl isomerase [Chitinophagales bacterium]
MRKSIFEFMLFQKRLTLAVLLLLGSVVLVQAQPKKVVADKILAIVGDKIILQSDIKNSISDIVRQGGSVPDNADCLLTEQAIVSKMLMLQAQKDSLPVTDEEVEADLDQRVRYFINQMGGSQQTLEEVAGKTIYQIKDDARESVKENKLATAMQKKIVENVKITPNEVKDFFDKIPKDSLPFFESELEIGQIVIYPKASRDMDKYIMDELNNYKKQVETRMITFAELAKRVSQDPGTKDQGGQFQINRNDKDVDPAFLAAAFRLKNGEISPPVRSKFGYHIIQMVDKNGDDAVVRHILMIPPVTDVEINEAKEKLDSVRSRIIAGTIGFNEAAGKYSEDEQAKFSGPFLLNRDGAPYVTIDQLDRDMVTTISTMKVGEYSQPVVFDAGQMKKGVRIVYLKSRSEPHRMNMHDDYSKISQWALAKKKDEALQKWIEAKIPTYYIMIDSQAKNECSNLKKLSEKEGKAF